MYWLMYHDLRIIQQPYSGNMYRRHCKDPKYATVIWFVYAHLWKGPGPLQNHYDHPFSLKQWNNIIIISSLYLTREHYRSVLVSWCELLWLAGLDLAECLSVSSSSTLCSLSPLPRPRTTPEPGQKRWLHTLLAALSIHAEALKASNRGGERRATARSEFLHTVVLWRDTHTI